MSNINKNDLISTVAKKTDLRKKDVATILEAITQEIMRDVANGKKVQLIGFGSFESRHRAARKGRNPQTGATIEISAEEIPAFKAGKAFKDLVKNN